jgi:hypothetical protein
MQYGTLAEVEDRAQNCKNAIKAYQESFKSLRTSTLNYFPRDYAETQFVFGNAYKTLAEEEKDRANNCRRARQAYEQAMEISTKLDLPEVEKQVKEKLSELDLICTQTN